MNENDKNLTAEEKNRLRAKRYYDKHKDDPEFKKKRSERTKEYWGRVKKYQPERWKQINDRKKARQKQANKLLKKYEENNNKCCDSGRGDTGSDNRDQSS